MEDYLDLKIKYFRFLNRRPVPKGEKRAYIGLRTFHLESMGQSSDPFENHVQAFNKALIELERLLKEPKIAFQESLKRELLIWRKRKVVKANFDGYRVSSPIVQPPISRTKEGPCDGYSLVSLFSGAFGLDLGFIAAGYKLKFANDIDELSYLTAKENLNGVPFILRDFDSVSSEEVLDISGLSVGEVDVLLGGPPCQPFSTAGKRAGFNDPRSSPLKGFIRAIKDLRPRIFVMEEVPGLKSSRLVHVPINERKNRDLTPDEEAGSAFNEVLRMLQTTGYQFVYGKLNAADYGAPQVRERLIFIGARDFLPSLPEPTNDLIPGAGLFSISLRPWTTFWEATADLKEDGGYVNYSDTVKRYMGLVPPGGHWRQLPENILPQAMGGAYNSGGGKMGFFRRLSLDEPSPTLVTSPTQKGTIFGHPVLLRPLGINEYKRLQGFPDDWFIPGSLRDKYKLIGNAVSVHFSFVLANHLKLLMNRYYST